VIGLSNRAFHCSSRVERMTEILKLVLPRCTNYPQVDDRGVIMLLSPHGIEPKIIREVVVGTAGIVVGSPYGMTCTECNELGSRLIKSTIRELRQGRQRLDNFAPACRSGLRCA
jgi:hypothetical protein